jgi:hypothetical protein
MWNGARLYKDWINDSSSLPAALDRCFVVMDRSGQKLAYIYFEDQRGQRFGSQPAHERRGAKDRPQYREAARGAGQLRRPTVPGFDATALDPHKALRSAA